MKTPKFYLYRKQSGEGCDYTLACGELLVPLDAETLDEAIEEALDEELDREGDERELDEAMIFAAPVHVFDLDAMKAKAREKARARKLAEADARERTEFERLQRKFGR